MHLPMRAIASLLMVLLLACHAAAGEPIVTKFTSTAARNSVALEQSKERDEGDFFKYLCPGFGGYQLIHEGGDSRSWINIKYGKTVVDLQSATMSLAPGIFPAKENDVVEWRGIVVKGKFIPYAIIYRLSGSDAETSKLRTRLIVIKLAREKSAIVGYAEGAGEEKKAEKIADGFRPK